MIQKVKLYFTLVGKSNAWKRKMPAGMKAEFRNSDTLLTVHDIVANRFGERALVIINEKILENDIYPYPEFYSAGWFVSDSPNAQELVVVDHGSSMEAATKAMLDSVKVIDWDSYAVKV